MVWLWICVLFVIAVTIIVTLKLTAKNWRDFVIGQSNSMPFFNMLSVCLGGTIPMQHTPSRNFARTVLVIWLFSTLVLRNAYQGKLFDNLRINQRKAPFFHLDKLFSESNLKLYLTPAYFQIVADNYPTQRHR